MERTRKQGKDKSEKRKRVAEDTKDERKGREEKRKCEKDSANEQVDHGVSAPLMRRQAIEGNLAGTSKTKVGSKTWVHRTMAAHLKSERYGAQRSRDGDDRVRRSIKVKASHGREDGRSYRNSDKDYDAERSRDTPDRVKRPLESNGKYYDEKSKDKAVHGCDARGEFEHMKGVAYHLLGLSLGKQAEISTSDLERAHLQSEALKSLEEAITWEKQSLDFIFELGLECAEHRNMNAALSYAKELKMKGFLKLKFRQDLAGVYISLCHWQDAEICLDKAKDLKLYSAATLHVQEAAQECKSVLDTVETVFPQGMPESFGNNKLQEMVGKEVELLPELLKQATLQKEAMAAYRQALLGHWNLDAKSFASIQKEFVVLGDHTTAYEPSKKMLSIENILGPCSYGSPYFCSFSGGQAFVLAKQMEEKGHNDEALQPAHQMQCAGMKSDQFTFVTMLGVCVGAEALQHGKQVTFRKVLAI
eukprot:Gb_15678 [translate_table: standard]